MQCAQSDEILVHSAAWVDYDNDGRLDLFISNYCDWQPESDPVCGGYCRPDVYRAEPMQLFHNNGDLGR